MKMKTLMVFIVMACIVACKRDKANLRDIYETIKPKSQSMQTDTSKHDTTMAVTGVMAVPAQHDKAVTFSKPTPYSGHITIVMLGPGRVYPPCEMLLIDPLNRKLGYDAKKKDRLAYQEIPDATLENFGEVDGESGSIQVRWGIEVEYPIIGNYHLQIIGTDTGRYLVHFRCSDINYNSSDSLFSNIEIKPGDIHKYQFHYENKRGYKAKYEQVLDN